jgi:hypothetical protein
MMITPRRVAAGVAACAALAAGAAATASAALAADHTQQLNLAAELVRQPPGKPWIVNLVLGADMGMSDGTVPAPVNHMKFSFTSGAKVHSDAFGVCTRKTLEDQGPTGCPASSKLGSGTAVANALATDFKADVMVFNGPGTVSNRKLYVYARAIQTVVIIMEGTLKKTSGKYGWMLDLPVPEIPTVGEGNDAAITSFSVKVGGFGKKHTPFIEAPTSCKGPGWPFFGTFSYSDGLSGTSSAIIPCVLKATNG